MAGKGNTGLISKKAKAKSAKGDMSRFPSISSVLEDERVKPLVESWSFAFVSSELKKIAAALKRAAAKGGAVPSKEELLSLLEERFVLYGRDLIQPVINCTGVILHTNLGRAPISSEIYETLVDAVAGYSNLEFDLAEGKRSQRGRMPGRIMAALAGAEAGMAVNNNAAAVYLIVANLAGPGKEVIISRGQLVQIGGGFRIHEIIERSGAILREVGTTNKTTLSDYQRAIGKNTGLMLVVHKSNFVQKGFTEEPEASRIVEMAQARKIPVCYDLGSGLIDTGGFPGNLDEPTVFSAMRSGADVVCFSGDKLLGGPQAGLIIGREKIIGALLKDPLYRAFRLDKLTIGLLEQTLLRHLRGEPLPCWEMASRPVDELMRKAEEIASAVGKESVSPTKLKSSFGGGSIPEFEFDSFGLKIKGNAVTLSDRLRRLRPAIVCRTASDGVLLDLRTVFPEQYPTLIDALRLCL